MKKSVKNLIKLFFKTCNIGVVKHDTLQRLLINESAADDIEFLLTLNNKYTLELIQSLRKSKSQLRQDLFVLSQLDFKKNGYFIEFGATNGIDLSNTYLLEKEFGWVGILAEPARCWHKNLQKNRDAHIEKKCVWRNSNSILDFNETEAAELSTINLFNNSDLHAEVRKTGKSYQVNTISLNDLLIKYNAPVEIDYMSIDTEGSEFEILNHFDFSKHKFNVITCEHNFTPMRDKIFKLLSDHGYVRKFQELSRFDDWYVRLK